MSKHNGHEAQTGESKGSQQAEFRGFGRFLNFFWRKRSRGSSQVVMAPELTPPNPDDPLIQGLLSDLGASADQRRILKQTLSGDRRLQVELSWALESCMTDHSLPFLRSYLDLLADGELDPASAMRVALARVITHPGSRQAKEAA